MEIKKLEDCENLAEVLLWLGMQGFNVEFTPMSNWAWEVEISNRGGRKFKEILNLPYFAETCNDPNLELFNAVKNQALSFYYK